jgi:hypothetical protein
MVTYGFGESPFRSMIVKLKISTSKITFKPKVVAHVCNSATLEAELEKWQSEAGMGNSTRHYLNKNLCECHNVLLSITTIKEKYLWRKKKRAVSMAYVVEFLPNKHKTLSSIPNTTKK